VLLLIKLNLGILFGGKSAEHEVSIMSARSVYEYADREKYNVYPIAVDKKGNWLDQKGSLKVIENNDIKKIPISQNTVNKGIGNFIKDDYDVIFPLIHGPYGEDGKIQGFFDLLGIPYVGADVLGSAIGMDKGIMKDLFAYHGLKQTEYLTFKKNNKNVVKLSKKFADKQGFPLFIKPANLGSSIGISKVCSEDEIVKAIENAFKYDNKIIVEKALNGREIECSVLGKDHLEASLPGEIIPSHDFYDYHSKYQDGKAELIIPAVLQDEQIKKIQKMAKTAFKIIEGIGLARVDFFVSQDQIYINEINTIPGFTEYSMYPKLWGKSGLSYPDLIDRLVEIALKKV